MLLLALGLSATAARAAHQVVFEIDMRAEIQAGRFDPAKDQVGVRGGVAPLSWGASVMARPLKATAEDPAAAGLYTAEITVERPPIGGALPYKFRIERAGQTPGEGWETGPNRSLELMAAQLRVARAFNAPAAPISLSRAGHIEALDPLPSRFVGPRGVQVWLPPGYENQPQRRYPVLYLHDGQNVFDAAAAGAEWAVDETAQHLTISGQIQPLIIVAVASTGRRVDEYTPTRMKLDGEMQGGQAGAYARYLVEELKPAIDARYRTLKDAAHTAVGGSSLGGVMSLWLALHHGDTFGAALVVSPSLWWDDAFPIRDTARAPLPATLPRPKLWLDMGTGEGDQSVRQLRQLRSQLFNRGWSRADLNYLEATGATHDEASWAARVEPMLLFLDRQVWPVGGAKTPAVGQDPYPPAPMVDINRPKPQPR